ncbi:hypothetical protein M3Y97_01050400 [Aphelenchoides bicaudatus]|nr:hypothetical protein M3Y97_01050400 [Aphelenchoides bicaudatus]
MALINLTKCRRSNSSSSVGRCYRRLFFVVMLFLIAILFIFFLNRLDFTKLRQYFFPSTQKYDKPFNFSDYNKFISLGEVNYEGRHGNILFRISSLFGIGRQLKRTACVEKTFNESFNTEFREVFPNLRNYVLLDNCWTDKAKFVDFHNEIWNFMQINTLEQYADENYIRLNTGVLECYLFFHRFRHEITKMFTFSTPFKQKIDGLAKANLWRRHSRQKFVPTLEEVTFSMIGILCFQLTSRLLIAKQKNLDKISILLLNDDVNFTNNVIRQVKKNSHVKNIFTTKNFKPIEDMGIATRHCDYFLLTSSGSTFGWWMAYLLPDEKQNNKNFAFVLKLFREEEFVLPEWNRLVHNLKYDTIYLQDRSMPGIVM